MASVIETCENCGKHIGKLETPRVFADQIVCRACWDTLSGDDPDQPTPRMQHPIIVTQAPIPPPVPGAERTILTLHPTMFRSDPVAFVLCIILSPILVGLIVLLIWRLKVSHTTLIVTSLRTTLKTGILGRSINEVYHRDVRNVQIQQSFFQRLMGVGAVGVSSAAQAGIEIAVDGIRSPMKVREIIDQQRRLGA